MFFKSRKGFALPTVIVIIAILLIICTSVLYVVSNQTLAVSRNKAMEDALHIAEAGYYKYLWYLNDDSAFYKLAGPTYGEFSPIEFYSASDPLWTGYPKKYDVVEYINGADTIGYFQIFVVPPSSAAPVLTVKSTGWTADNADVRRTIEVQIHKRQFTNYVDFSGDMKDASGASVYWGDGEQARGPVFTNGTLRTMGKPVFYDTVTYVEGWEKRSGTPDFKKPGQPKKGTALAFPSSNSSIVQWADTAKGGYTYTGRTCILLNGSQLKISNANTAGDSGVVDTPAARPLPSSGVIYVDGALFISGELDGRLTVAASGSIYICGKDPTNYTYSGATTTGGIIYKNQNIPTSPTASLINQSDDMLGLISNGSILINTRYWPKSGSSTTHQSVSCAVPNIKVQAAVFGLSSKSYYGVDNYAALGDMGYIKFTGSKIASRTGATYTTSWGGVRGYKEDNSFDYRLAYETPPHFLEPVNSGWEVKQWREAANP